ncbi:YbaK/EbsC family protein, partial [Mesorhizobium sp.]|uniref:aminoacyl-tRNA deacylase n=1 Tax=Mesorhizobium sp. TaxID=1871066 RepID=UPI0025B989FE
MPDPDAQPELLDGRLALKQWMAEPSLSASETVGDRRHFNASQLKTRGAKMTIANKLKHFIDGKGVFYDTVEHHRTSTSRQSAIAAHVPGSIMAKSVVVHHELGYALAVVPSTHRIELGTLQSIMDKRLGLASEDEVVS